MGTRDIYIALIITIIFILCIDFLFNEESSLCILPESFTDHHVSKLNQVTDEEIKKAKETIAKAEAQVSNISNTIATDLKSITPVF